MLKGFSSFVHSEISLPCDYSVFTFWLSFLISELVAVRIVVS